MDTPCVCSPYLFFPGIFFLCSKKFAQPSSRYIFTSLFPPFRRRSAASKENNKSNINPIFPAVPSFDAPASPCENIQRIKVSRCLEFSLSNQVFSVPPDRPQTWGWKNAESHFDPFFFFAANLRPDHRPDEFLFPFSLVSPPGRHYSACRTAG